MRTLLAFLLTFAATQSLSDSVTFLGTNSTGNAVFMINNSHATDVRQYRITAGGSTIGYNTMGPGNHIVEHVALSVGEVVTLKNDSNVTITSITLSDVSTSFSIQSNTTDDVGSIQGSLVSDAIKQNATAQTNNAAAIDRNTQKINKNSVGVAEAMALGVMQMDLNYEGLQTSIGAAKFNGSEGFAFMAGKMINRNTFMSFSATSTGNVAGGVTIKW